VISANERNESTIVTTTPATIRRPTSDAASMAIRPSSRRFGSPTLIRLVTVYRFPLGEVVANVARRVRAPNSTAGQPGS
jgi:hypothetical protein